MTLNLCGYERSHFLPSVESSNFEPKSGMARLAKTIFSENFVVATFGTGETQNGQSEFAFSLTLPECVTESLMI